MAIVSFSTFTFSKLWTSSTDFPTVETSENQVRQDLQELHDQTKDYINNDLIPKLNQNFNACVKSDAIPAATETAVGGVKVGNGLQISSSKLSVDFDKIYPVGSIYMSVNSTNPGTLFGGTWARLQGRFLLGADSTYSAGSTGGEAAHTLTNAEMPSHTHTGPKHKHTGPSHSHSVSITSSSAGKHTHTLTYSAPKYFVRRDDDAGSSGYRLSQVSTSGLLFVNSSELYSNENGAHTHSVSGNTGAAGMGYTSENGTGATGSAGSGSAHNNMPPYLAVYMWKRTA